MSRYTSYKDQRLTVITGHDHALGEFWQIYDKEWINKTPAGEGLVFDWSQLFKTETNYTGITSDNPETIVNKYIENNNHNS